jgi:hypothetical protein
VTLLVWPAATETTLPVHGEAAQIVEVSAARTTDGARLEVGAFGKPVWARVWIGGPVGSVTVGQAALTQRADRAALDGASEGWWQASGSGYVWLRVGQQSAAAVITIEER